MEDFSLLRVPEKGESLCHEAMVPPRTRKMLWQEGWARWKSVVKVQHLQAQRGPFRQVVATEETCGTIRLRYPDRNRISQLPPQVPRLPAYQVIDTHVAMPGGTVDLPAPDEQGTGEGKNPGLSSGIFRNWRENGGHRIFRSRHNSLHNCKDVYLSHVASLYTQAQIQ
jgi:hypothetical protein